MSRLFYSFYAHFSHIFEPRFRSLINNKNNNNNNNNNNKDVLIVDTNNNKLKEYSYQNTIHKKLKIATQDLTL